MELKTSDKMEDELKQIIGNQPGQVTGMGVIAYRDGKEVCSHFEGSAVLATQGSPCRTMTRDSRFRIASISKMFVAFTLLQLVEAGKLDLDVDVSRYLGFTLRNPGFPDTPITTRMLAGHTSSLRDGKIYSIPPEYSLREFFTPTGRYWENGAHFAPPTEPPQKYFAYANLNYGILGTIIEIITGERFDKYQKEHILTQLETGADYVPGNFSPAEFAKLGAIYQWERGTWRGKIDDYRGIKPPSETVFLQNPYAEEAQYICGLQNYRPGNNATIFSPTGGLRISCEELTHALEMLLNEGRYHGRQVLSSTAVRLMFKEQWFYDPGKKNGDTENGSFLSYGLGAYRINSPFTTRFFPWDGENFFGHEGEAFGLTSLLALNPAKRSGIVCIVNGMHEHYPKL